MADPIFEALIFDLGGVIVGHDNAVLFVRLASRCREAWGPARVAALFRESRWGTGAPIRDFHRQLSEEAGYAAPWSTFVDDWCCHLVLDPSMLKLVERLATRNRVMILSNTNQEHWDFAVRASCGRLARLEPYLSHEIGHEKPSLQAFAVVAEKAGIEPGRSMFIDDVLTNVEAARRAGFQSELFVGEAPLIAFLVSRRVLFG